MVSRLVKGCEPRGSQLRVREVARRAYVPLSACLAGNEDLCRAICAELESAFGIGCTPASAADLPKTRGRAMELSGELRAGEGLDKPAVTVTLHPGEE